MAESKLASQSLDFSVDIIHLVKELKARHRWLFSFLVELSVPPVRNVKCADAREELPRSVKRLRARVDLKPGE